MKKEESQPLIPKEILERLNQGKLTLEEVQEFGVRLLKKIGGQTGDGTRSEEIKTCFCEIRKEEF